MFKLQRPGETIQIPLPIHQKFVSPFGFDFDGFNVFGRDWFAFGMKGSIDIQTVSGNLSRGVQYQKGVNRAYE